MNIKLTNLYRVKNIILLAFLVAVFNGCSDEENKEALTPITFTTHKPTVEAVPYVASQKQTKSFAIGNIVVTATDLQALSEQKLQSTWETGDKIGIYGIKANNELASENIWDNINNMVFNYQDGNKFTAEQSVYYPEDKSSLDFIAYYPHSENITADFNYNINVADNKDVLYSNNLKGLNAENNNNNTLIFQRVLTKLYLNITPNPAGASLSGLKVTLKNIKTKATLSLKTGALTIDDTSTGDVQLSAANNNVIEAYLLPTSENIDAVFEVGGKTYEWQITGTMEAGKVYCYNITLSGMTTSGKTTKYMELPLYNPAGKTTYNVEAPNSITVTHQLEDISWLNTDYVAPKSMRNYSIGYNTASLEPYWVAYPMHPVYLGKVEREDKWIYDPLIPHDKQPVLKDAYSDGSTYDKGHMMASDDRSATQVLNATTFYYTNVAPQHRNLNRGRWLHLEKAVRYWCTETAYDTLYVVAGNILPKNASDYYYTEDNNGRKIVIPEYCYKALLRYNKEKKQYESIGFKMRNEIVTGKSYRECATTVAELEKETGFIFFSNLPDDIEQQVKQQKNLDNWPKVSKK